MNRVKKNIFFILGIMIAQLSFCGALVEETSKKLLPTSGKLFPTIVEERQERLAARKKERAAMVAADKEFNNGVSATIEQLKNDIDSNEQLARMNPDSEQFIRQKIQLELERLQANNDLKEVRTKVIGNIDKLNKQDQEYLADPKFIKLGQTFLGKSSYSFDEDLLPIYEKIREREKDIAALNEQETNALSELQTRKRAAQATIDAFQASKEKKEPEIGLSARQKAELDTLKEQAFNDRRAADAMKINEIELKHTIAQTELFTAKKQLDELKGILQTIKPLTKINEADVTLALEDLDKKKQQARPVKEGYQKEIEKINLELREKEKELDALSKRFNIPLGGDLDEWSKEPKRTLNSYLALAKVGTLNDEVLGIKRKKELLEAYNSLEDERLHDEALRIGVKDSFFKISNSLFNTEETLSAEIKKYQIQKDENKTNLALYKERLNNVSSMIASQKKALENLTSKLQSVEQEKNSLFKTASLEYEQYVALLKHAQSKIEEQIDLLGKLTGLYTDIISKISNAGKHIDFIIEELGTITPWGRPAHAISWDGIKNSIPDAQAFIKDVGTYIGLLNVTSIWNTIADQFLPLRNFYNFLVKFLVLLAILFFIKLSLPMVTQNLVSIQAAPAGIRWAGVLIAVILGFIARHLVSILIWLTLVIFLVGSRCLDPFPYILFYLFSIPYLMYLANRFMKYLVYFNEHHDYCLLNKEYQDRFILVVSTLLYATIAIVCFREAFILGNYHKSELPTLLLTINFIIFQISAILLLSKDQILSLISVKTDFGKALYDLIDTYYYLLQFFLIAVIVMSNPYVGYGRLVLYILKRLLYTAILLQLLLWLHEWIKRISSGIFFYFDTDDEIARDRFAYAKTWYGLLVVLIFVIFIFVGLLIAARIWHWPEMLLKVQKWSDVMAWIKTPFLLENTSSPISLYTIFKIIGFLIAGSLVAFAINRFVLGRIFDILLVDSGIQNTIATLSRYLIIITATILGFHAANLGDVVKWLLGGLILAIGWVIKDPVADLIAYFIIIVQRPVKVGDYIFLNDNVNGFVRRITPRSVEIRRKNSTTVLVPNLQITTQSVANWNHARSFIAFDDIMVTIPYKADPAQVRELLLRVLDESRVILKNPRPVVRLENFSDLGYVFLVRGYMSSNHTGDMWDIASDIRFAIVKRLHEHDIQIAYPVRVVVTNSGNIERKKEIH